MKVALALALAGCYRPAHVAGDAAAVDVAPGSDTSSGTCFGSGAFELCVTAPSPGPLVLPAMIFTSTVSGNPVDSNCLASSEWAWVAAGQPDACVMFASDVQTGATTRVFGARPLIVLGIGSITIAANQLVDVASHQGAAYSGPGAASGTCAPFASTPRGNISNGIGASGGGAGGSFAIGLGGGGGAGDNTLSGGKAATTVQLPKVLTAGCTGQTAPGGTPNISAAPGGIGGGALYLAAQTNIVIHGRINASGAGGGVGGTDFQTGGGGGGSGGMIVIYAPAITATGTIIANGGGGASGGSYETIPQLTQQAAKPGADPDPMMPSTAAAGGGGTLAAGGAGSVMGQSAMPGATGNNTAGQGDAGGGGGGGGGGVIFAPAGALAGAMVSPPAVAGP